MNIELLPMKTPDFVIQKRTPKNREAGFVEAPKFSLKEIPAETLDELCNEFRAEIFLRAGKEDPTTKTGSH